MYIYEIIRCDCCDFESARNAYSEKSIGHFATQEKAQAALSSIPPEQLTPYIVIGGDIYPKFKMKKITVID